MSRVVGNIYEIKNQTQFIAECEVCNTCINSDNVAILEKVIFIFYYWSIGFRKFDIELFFLIHGCSSRPWHEINEIKLFMDKIFHLVLIILLDYFVYWSWHFRFVKSLSCSFFEFFVVKFDPTILSYDDASLWVLIDVFSVEVTVLFDGIVFFELILLMLLE